MAQPKRRQPKPELELPADFDGLQTAMQWLDLCAVDIGTATGVAARLDGIEAAAAVKDGLNQNIELLKASLKELRDNVAKGSNEKEEWRPVLQLAAKRIRDTQTYVQIGHNFTSLANKKKKQHAAKLQTPCLTVASGLPECGKLLATC